MTAEDETVNGKAVVVRDEVVLQESQNSTATASPPRLPAKHAGGARPWRNTPRVLATMDLLTAIIIERHPPSETLELLNRSCQRHGLPEVSARSLRTYKSHVYELWAEASTRTLGEFDAATDYLWQRNLEILNSPDSPAILVSTAQKELRELVALSAKLHGRIDSRGGGVAVQVNVGTLPAVVYQPGAEAVASKADAILDALDD